VLQAQRQHQDSIKRHQKVPVADNECLAHLRYYSGCRTAAAVTVNMIIGTCHLASACTPRTLAIMRQKAANPVMLVLSRSATCSSEQNKTIAAFDCTQQGIMRISLLTQLLEWQLIQPQS
jgi:hypothetical protein